MGGMAVIYMAGASTEKYIQGDAIRDKGTEQITPNVTVKLYADVAILKVSHRQILD